MKIVYDGLEDVVTVLGSGTFKKGEPVEVTEELGAELLSRGIFLGVKPEDKQ